MRPFSIQCGCVFYGRSRHGESPSEDVLMGKTDLKLTNKWQEWLNDQVSDVKNSNHVPKYWREMKVERLNQEIQRTLKTGEDRRRRSTTVAATAVSEKMRKRQTKVVARRRRQKQQRRRRRSRRSPPKCIVSSILPDYDDIYEEEEEKENDVSAADLVEVEVEDWLLDMVNRRGDVYG